MLIAVASLKGSPGVTTFSLALASRWPAPARTALMEIDPSGGDVATRFCLPPSPGLLSLAVAARTSTDHAVLWQHAHALPGGLSAVIAPPDADLTQAALCTLTSNSSTENIFRSAARDSGTVMIADCGRIDHSSAAMHVVRQADALVLLTRAHADNLAHLTRRLPAAAAWTPHPVLLLVGNGYATADVAHELGVMPLGRIPHDPRGADVLCGLPPGSRWRSSEPSRSPLGRYAYNIAVELQSRIARRPSLSLITGTSPEPTLSPASRRPADDAFSGHFSWTGVL
ncbi:chromosome partitioning protein [Lentzea sp. HUAS12]|uniref:chromosome partitioning protein n=1 Tax=Lentzea sp. HUAS12 TaxID=2951806 RepID=UPI00209F414C|nr:chromosome partitioning protein [Lentzea sp. HUAS12]USX56434.1 chromosome partitioning protein [Lentzea sp. HUAS12]